MKKTVVVTGAAGVIGRNTVAKLNRRGKDQYFTEARMDKLRHAGYRQEFMSVQDGVRAYVESYLSGQGMA